MNRLTDSLLQVFKPRLAVVVYSSESNDFSDCYLESHVIDEKGRLLEGKALKQQTLDAIVDVFFDDRKNNVRIEGLIPDNLLQFDIQPGGHYKMIWFRPQEKRHLFFRDELNIASGVAWVPPMIYMAGKTDLHVFALTSNVRPQEETPLFRAPYHNVGESGVCLGSAKVEKPAKRTYQNLMKYWEDLFWRSEFTHITGESPTVGNVNMIWQKLIADNGICWDSLTQELKPLRKKLADIL